MHRFLALTLSIACVLALSALSAHCIAQEKGSVEATASEATDREGASSEESSVASDSTTPNSGTSDSGTSDSQHEEVRLSALELTRKAVAADANARYGMLNGISPRGATQEDRAAIVKLLIEQLDSDYADIRARTATVLGLFGADAKPAIPRLIQLLDDEEPTVTLEAVWVQVSKAISAIGAEHALEPLMDALGETFEYSIAKDVSGKYVVDWGNRVRYYGITGSIAAMGDEAKSTAPVFIDLLRNGPENRRWATMYTLSRLGDASAPAIPDLIDNLDHPDFNFKVIACRALAEHGAKAKAAVPKLVKLMEKKGNMLSTRTHAAMCLGAIGPVDGVDSIGLIIEMIEEPNAFSQERGLTALGRLGTHAKEQREFVEDLLANKEFSQRPEAARTLWQITGETDQALEVMTALIDNPTYDTRVYTMLEEMGPAAAPMSELLVERLDTDDQSLRQQIVELLVNMGPVAKKHIASIRSALDGAAPDTAVAIDRALEKINGGSSE